MGNGYATVVTFEITDCMKFIENHLGKGTFLNVQVQPAQK